MAEKFKPQAFGRYYLTHFIAHGGMAEIFKAKTFGTGGFEKQLALKRILPQFSEDKNFLGMLADEARLTVQLNHPNIVQVFDFGKTDNQFYLSMELVEGVNLSALIERAREKKEGIPIDVACYLVSEVSRGLDYAHNKKGKDGKPLELVHRDINPSNIMVSYEGSVKIADFGIAKAATNLNLTQTGAIKGKICYLSPEQAQAKAIDHRTDIFTTGLLLYELLTLNKFFSGKTQIEVLSKVSSVRVGREHLPSGIPEALKDILMKSLAFEVTDRTQKISELQESLTAYLYQINPKFTTKRLSEYLKDKMSDHFSSLERQLDPPMDTALRKNLVDHTGDEILASAETSPELLDKTLLVGKADDRDVTRAFARSSKMISVPFALMTFLLFLFSDFLKPLVSLAPLFLFISLFMVALIYFVTIRGYLSSNPMSRILISRQGGAFVFAVLSLFVWGLATVVSLFTPHNGVMASTLPTVATLQKQLLNLGVDVREIKETTQEIAETTRDISEKTEAISEGVTDIKEAIRGMTKEPGIIQDPKSPQEFYHNARQYELAGQHRDAGAAYEKFIEREPNYIDVHESYQTMLNNSGGVEKTQRVYKELLKSDPENPVLFLMYSRLLPKNERLEKLDLIAKSHPTFAPVFLDLVNARTDDGVSFGLMPAREMKLTKVDLDQFRQLDGEGYYKEYFIDKDALEGNLSVARRYQTLFENYYNAILKDNVKIALSKTGKGYSLSLMPQEPGAQKIFFSLGDPANFKETGASPYMSAANGLPMPNYQVDLGALKPGTYVVYAKYLDKDGFESTVAEKEVVVE